MSLYFIALNLPKELQEQIHKIKQEVSEKYEAKHALKLPAHITLQIPFKFPKNEEGNLIEILKALAENQKYFRVDLNGFGRFNQKVIFINIEDHKLIKELHANLHSVLLENFKLTKHENFPKIHPHITIASRDLHYKQFPVAWANFHDRNFEASFTVNSFSLLKHDGKQWHCHYDFYFKE